MAVTWEEAPQRVLDIARRIIDKHHPNLRFARIAFVMRSEASKSAGRLTLGKAKKVSPELQLHIEYDFIIWVAADWWQRLSPLQREALIDHELSHCKWDIDEKAASLVGHDVEEFTHIIQRYGFWWPMSDDFEVAVQQHLPLPKPQRSEDGVVGTLDFGKVAQDAAQAMRAEGIDVEVTHTPGAARNK